MGLDGLPLPLPVIVSIEEETVYLPPPDLRSVLYVFFCIRNLETSNLSQIRRFRPVIKIKKCLFGYTSFIEKYINISVNTMIHV
jgi:hypothetical protein